jgi:phosphatidylglycerol:prolipoprotein diacylglycerol transferase
MRQTLIRIPLDGHWSLGPLGEVPGFGWGLVLALWACFAAFWIWRNRSQLAVRDWFLPALIWVAVAAVIIRLPHWMEREFDRVIAASTETIEQNPASAEAHFLRGEAWYAKRNYANAVADYERAITLDAEHDRAYRDLAWILATCPDAAVRDGAKAVKAAERACQLTGFGDPPALDALAAAYAEAGRFGDARRHAQRAAEIAGASQDPRVQVDLPGYRARIQSYVDKAPFRDPGPGRSIPIYGYGFMMVLGFFAAGWTGTRLGRWVGIDPNTVLDLAVWVFFSGVVGARLFYCIQYAGKIFFDDSGTRKSLSAIARSIVNLPDGGLVLYGGIIMAVVVFLAYCRAKGLKPLLLADVFMASFFVGLGFGRLGCFLNGCCYGDRSDLPWAVLFPMGSVPDMALVSRGFVGSSQILDVWLHPAQIYSSINAFVLFLICAAYFRYRPRDGSVLALGLIVYPITRFVLEFLRGDELGQFHTPLTIAQWVSIGMLASGLVYLAWLSRGPAAVTQLVRETPRVPSAA